jgi:hypothetical protein
LSGFAYTGNLHRRLRERKRDREKEREREKEKEKEREERERWRPGENQTLKETTCERRESEKEREDRNAHLQRVKRQTDGRTAVT